MATIGSSFLGDAKHLRHLASGSTPGSTPPSSPPPPISPHGSTTQSFPAELIDSSKQNPSDPSSRLMSAPPHHIAPAQSLEMRLRWLEALLYGVRQDPTRATKGLKKNETLMRGAEEIKRRMDEIAAANDGLRRFVDHYHQYAHLLTPAFALSGTLPAAPAYENMSPAELDAFLLELEPDIRAADRDMREIELLEQKGVTGAGKLPDYEALQPRLNALIERYHGDAQRAASLEQRIAGVIRQYATQVDSLSELFVLWDEALRDAEDKVAKLEKDKEDRVRLGYE